MEAEPAVKRLIKDHLDLEVYRRAFASAMRLFELSKAFPPEERHALTDQIRRSSRSVCANLAEAWRRRRYVAAFVSKLNECEAEAAETQTWIRFAQACGYVSPDNATSLLGEYDIILAMLVRILTHPNQWTL